MKKFGKTTFIGLTIGLAFVIGGVVTTGQTELFWNLPSFFIIVGGTIGSFVMAFSIKDLKRFPEVFIKAFDNDEFDIRKDIYILVKLSEILRTKGLLAIDEYIDDYVDEPFLKEGIMMIVDGADEERLRDKLEGETFYMKKRHQNGAAMMDMPAETAPALGLLGTYVGLIPMLNNLDDPSSLGPMMVLELVSSFYGAFIAYVIFSPIAKKLKVLSKEELNQRSIFIEGLVGILNGVIPRLLKDELASYAHISVFEIDAMSEDNVTKEVGIVEDLEMREQYES